LALQAAQQAAGAQDYPKATLYMVATPIGNLADISLRALHVLGLVDRIACEDSRHTSALLTAYGLHKPLLPVHQHNEQSAATQVLEHLRAGERIAYVSDAGTPGVSDPGAVLVHAVQAQGFRVMPLPGASSVTALISATGGPRHDDAWARQGFVFAGFLPAKGQARSEALQALGSQERPVVFMEAPHRLDKLALELLAFGQRTLVLGRELSKRFEQIERIECAALAPWLSADAQRSKGEFVLVLMPAIAQADASLAQASAVLDLLLEELSVKSASRLAAAITGHNKKALYDLALQRQGRKA
jgi:16S rRNA (cytidine1402-2'-O)-methyltransferase